MLQALDLSDPLMMSHAFMGEYRKRCDKYDHGGKLQFGILVVVFNIDITSSNFNLIRGTNMADHQEQEKTSDSSASLSKTDKARLKLKLIARYALLGLVPVVAIVALAVAVIAIMDNRSSQKQLGETAAKIEGLNTSLLATKGEFEKLKALMAKEKALQNEELSKQDERVSKIIQNITPMQVKMKIRPTLDEQLSQPASVSAVVPVTPHVTAPAVPHAAAPATPHPSGATSAPAKTPVSADKKISPQVKAMKEAIQQYNKK